MKRCIIQPLTMFCCLLTFSVTYGQQETDKGIHMYSTRLQEKLKPTSLHYWLDIKNEEAINAADFLNNYKADLNLAAADIFSIQKELKDKDGNKHNRFQQYHNGIKVEGAECIVHEMNGKVKSVNGRWASDINISKVPSLNESGGLSIALGNIKSKAYLWLNKDADKYAKLIKDKNISIQPKGELVYCRINNNGEFDADNITLAWKFTLLVLPMHESAIVYVDATNGKLIKKLPLSLECTTGSGATTWYGTRSFSTSWRGWPDNTYHLDTDEGGCANLTNIMSRRGDPIVTYNYGDANNSWVDANGLNGYNQRAGVTTHWSLINAYNYYRYTHGRLSYDDGNAELSAFSEISGGDWLDDPNNANWNPVFHTMHFGRGSTAAPTDDWNCTDIVGHEMTHGVVQFASGLEYAYESGALNESFADIFGEMIDGYATGTIDWLVGAKRGAIRSFIDPNSMGQPDTYGVGAAYWYAGAGDNGGVHYNSGVQNYWFYLLSVGGSGTNDLGKTFSVASLGTSTASAIVYRNLEYYMISSSVYKDAREGAIRAAEDLYGSCSNQVIQTANAWYAVGVGYDEYINSNSLCGTYSGTSINLWKNPDAVNIGQTCSVSFSSTGTGSKAIMSGTSITFYPGTTATQNFTAYINSCAVAAYSLTAVTAKEESVVTTINESAITKTPETKTGNITLYPNPAKDYVTIKSVGSINKNNCFITDVSGRRIAASFTSDNTIDVSKLSAGIYFLHMMEGTKSTSIRFVKL